ncbi:hypothetical protein AURDEDRAFT_121954 [Auricularia subglabra TFB-10046 SS5]|nr:hypothetical protein AURDEDRAFT_121954 [Auricularia subglabra TFB-10046 SS5]
MAHRTRSILPLRREGNKVVVDYALPPHVRTPTLTLEQMERNLEPMLRVINAQRQAESHDGNREGVRGDEERGGAVPPKTTEGRIASENFRDANAASASIEVSVSARSALGPTAYESPQAGDKKPNTDRMEGVSPPSGPIGQLPSIDDGGVIKLEETATENVKSEPQSPTVGGKLDVDSPAPPRSRLARAVGASATARAEVEAKLRATADGLRVQLQIARVEGQQVREAAVVERANARKEKKARKDVEKTLLRGENYASSRTEEDMQARSEGGSSLVPGLRRQIAIVGDPGALTQLCLVDWEWHSECTPVLYERVGLAFGLDQKQLARSAAFLRTLEGSPRKASLVRTLMIHYSLGRIGSSGEDVDSAAVALTKQLFSRDLFSRLVNLADLRIRNRDLADLVCKSLADVLGFENPPVRLRTLHIPHDYGRFPEELGSVFLAQRETLRTLGVQTVWKTYDCSWPLKWGVLHEDCIVFGFSNNMYNAPFDWLAVHDARDPPRIAQSLDVESTILIPRRLRWSCMFFIIDVDLRTGPDVPTRDTMRRLADYFPHLGFLTIRVGNLANLLEVVPLVSPFPDLRNLVLEGEGAKARELDDTMRSRVAEAIVAAGCEELSQVTFPDKSSRCWSGEDDEWFDPETVGSEDEEEEDDEDSDE